MRPGSIGILGGTFDPFHLGHLALARAARDRLGLERLLVVPAAAPPHKLDRPMSPPDIRLAMVEAGIAGEPRMEASRIELDRAGPSFTVETVAALAERERAAGRTPDITVVLSAESFAGLLGWHEPERLLDLARIAVAPRAGHPRAGPRGVRCGISGAPRPRRGLRRPRGRRVRVVDPPSRRCGAIPRGSRSARPSRRSSGTIGCIVNPNPRRMPRP